MKFEFKRGFSVFSNGNSDCVFAALHSGPAIENPVQRDDHSETVSSLCWKEIGGNLIISGVSRDRLWGIDFNRSIPSLTQAMKNYDLFVDRADRGALLSYTRKYAWVAKDENDYYERLKIYQSFWEEASKGKYIVLVHKNFPKMKAIPSIMDFVTFSEQGIKKKVIQEIINDLNSKYFEFFEKINMDYKNAILAESRRFVLNLLRVYGHFNPNEMSEGFKIAIEKEIDQITKYTDKIALNRLKQNFSPHNYLMCVENSLKHIPLPQVTVEAVHDGSLALGPYNKLFPKRDKTVIEVESNGFLNFWHPHMAAKIILDVVEKIKEGS